MRTDVAADSIVILIAAHWRAMQCGGPVPYGTVGRVSRQRFIHEERMRDTAVHLIGYGFFFVPDANLRPLSAAEIEHAISG